MENERAFAKKWLLLQPVLLAVVLLYALAYSLAQRLGLSLFHCNIAARIGLYCPGCGGSRAALALCRGRIAEAFFYYPPIPLAALCLLIADIRITLYLLGRGRMPSRRFGYGVLILCVASVIALCIVRNVLLLRGIDPLGDILG